MELASLAGLLHDAESKISPVLQDDELSCLTWLQKCLKAAQLVIASFNELSVDFLGLKSQHQV